MCWSGREEQPSNDDDVQIGVVSLLRELFIKHSIEAFLSFHHVKTKFLDSIKFLDYDYKTTKILT